MKFLRCLTAVLLVGGVACQSDNLTVPDLVLPEAASTPVPVEVEPTVIEPTPEGGRGSNPGPTSADIERGTCKATLTNVGQAPHGVTIIYTLPGTEAVVYASREVEVPAKGVLNVSSAQAFFEASYEWGEEECDFNKDVQCDFTAGSGEHIGHAGASISIHNPECDECREAAVTTITSKCGDWSECHVHPSFTESCFREKACVETTSIKYLCQDDVTRTREYEESEPCECPGCIDTPDGTVSLSNTSGSPLRVNATATDSGNWEVCITASSRLSECEANDPDYWKTCEPARLECDGQAAWGDSYSWRGHGAEYWRGVLRRNGSVFKSTACIRNPLN